MLISGAHCAGCIQKIESTLTQEKDVQSARLNFSTRRLAIEWCGDIERANDYVSLIESLGYGVRPYHANAAQEDSQNEERFLLMCLGVAGFAMGNVMLLSVGVWSASIDTMGMMTRDFMHWVSAFIALPTILYAGRPFFRSAFKALSNGHTNMDVPISIAFILTCGMSIFETLHHGEYVYFDSAVMLCFFLLIGRYLDVRARRNARSTATDLLNSLHGFATVIEGNQTRKVLIKDLTEGMHVRVHTGENFPIDGVVIEGKSDVDTSLVTGETMPRAVQIDNDVFAGTLNLSAPVVIKVSKAADDSLLSQIVRLMEKAGQSQARYVRLADQAAKHYTPIVHSFAAMAFLGWLMIGGIGWQDSLIIAITVLIITCPCALGLAVPVVQVLASSRLMKNGILVKSGDALERLATIDTVMLDKTGTLTVGQPRLIKNYDASQLKMAASLAVHSMHPLSKALAESYDGVKVQFENVLEHAGQGLEGRYQDKLIKLGSRNWCGNINAPSSEHSEIWLNIEDEEPVLFELSDALRQDSMNVIEQFKAMDITPIMLTGDRTHVAHKIGAQAHIDVIYAEQTPLDKYNVLDSYKQKDHKVLMIGDGLNDAPVLAAADISIAPGSAIDMAQNAADIVFMSDRLAPVYTAFTVARLSQKLIKQNFALAVGYNLIAIPLAVAGFVTPLVAAIAMSGSSLIVIANSFRLKSNVMGDEK